MTEMFTGQMINVQMIVWVTIRIEIRTRGMKDLIAVIGPRAHLASKVKSVGLPKEIPEMTIGPTREEILVLETLIMNAW
uniref:Uncharacterized protein n=1 Tax=Candidozyma auris TaxID=498019 RepID=A0A0L0NR15_CANAR